MADPLSTASAVSSGITTSLRIFQIIYEIQAVGEQTRDLLETTKLVTETVTQVKTLRHQKSSLLNDTEKAYVDNCITATENAVNEVAGLVERARADMVTRQGRTKDISLKTRALYVLKDSPKVATNINRMSIATQGLNASMGILCSRTGPGKVSPYRSHSSAADRRASSPKPPPPYELVEFLQRRTKSDPERVHEFARTAASLTGELERNPTLQHHKDVSDDVRPRSRYRQSVSPSGSHRDQGISDEGLGRPTFGFAEAKEGCGGAQFLAVPRDEGRWTRDEYFDLPVRATETSPEGRTETAEYLAPIPPPIPPRPAAFPARVMNQLPNPSHFQQQTHYQEMPGCLPNEMQSTQPQYKIRTTIPQRRPVPTPSDTTIIAEMSPNAIYHSSETSSFTTSVHPTYFELDSNTGLATNLNPQVALTFPPPTRQLLVKPSLQSLLPSEMSATSASISTFSFELPAEDVHNASIRSFSSSPATIPRRQLSHGRRWLEDHAV